MKILLDDKIPERLCKTCGSKDHCPHPCFSYTNQLESILSQMKHVQSPWTVEQAAVLLKISKRDLDVIGLSFLYSRHNENLPNLPVFLHDLITLSIAHKASGLSLEDFIKGMEEYRCE